MPIYEYLCEQCKHQFDELQKVNDAPLTECPSCHKNSLSKLISSTAFQLKGTGWYVTDFKNTKPKSEAKSENPAPTASEETPAKATSTTPATSHQNPATDSSAA